jgi:hypothetical protein
MPGVQMPEQGLVRDLRPTAPPLYLMKARLSTPKGKLFLCPKNPEGLEALQRNYKRFHRTKLRDFVQFNYFVEKSRWLFSSDLIEQNRSFCIIAIM